MNILDFTIIILILVVIYTVLFKNKKEQFVPNKFQNDDYDNDDIDYDEDPAKYIDKILKSKNKQKVNPYFLEMQFHQDYRDTSNAFNMLSPDQRQLFNRSDLPITNSTKPSDTEIKHLITKFVKEVNKTVKNHVSDELNLTGWHDNMPDKKYESGWEKQQKELGLPGSIYIDPAGKAPIKLIKLDHSEKYETDDEVKYVIFLIIQKKNVADQMVLRISFVIEKRDLNLDREFFDKSKDTYETSVKIEEIFILGYMTTHSFGKKMSRDKFYDFDKITDGRMFSQKDIIKMLNKKRKQYEKECHE